MFTPYNESGSFLDGITGIFIGDCMGIAWEDLCMLIELAVVGQCVPCTS